MRLKEDQQNLDGGPTDVRLRRWNFHIELIKEDDIPNLVEITLHAFKDDAMTNGCFREDVDPRLRREEERRWREQKWRKILRQPESGQWCIKAVATPAGTVSGASNWQDGFVDEAFQNSKHVGSEHSKLVGYAIWLDDSVDDVCPYSTVSESGDAVDVHQVDDPPYLNKSAYEDVCRVIEMTTDRVLKKRKDVWHLEHLTTHPDFQRQGVGSMLLRWGVERANLGRCAVYTEASKAGYRLYRKFGLERIKKMLFKNGGYRIAMLREPIEW